MSDKKGNWRINKQTSSGAKVIFPKLWLVPLAVYKILKQYIFPSATRKPKHVYYYRRTKAVGKEWQTIVGVWNKKGTVWLDRKWNGDTDTLSNMQCRLISCHATPVPTLSWITPHCSRGLLFCQHIRTHKINTWMMERIVNSCSLATSVSVKVWRRSLRVRYATPSCVNATTTASINNNNNNNYHVNNQRILSLCPYCIKETDWT
jgi:hypothetical protein